MSVRQIRPKTANFAAMNERMNSPSLAIISQGLNHGPPTTKPQVTKVYHLSSSGNAMAQSEPSIPIVDCQICFDTFVIDETHKFEQCGHRFCKECATSYVRLKVIDGNVYPKCCYCNDISDIERKISNEDIESKNDNFSSDPLQITSTEENNPNSSKINMKPTLHSHSSLNHSLPNQVGIKHHICETFISHQDILNLLSDDMVSLERYIRFKYCQENKDARECPQCGTFHIGNPADPKIICSKCSTNFCFFHSNAHNFDTFPTCEEYEKSLTKDVKASEDYIKIIAKPCPGCQMMVTKSGGCNHMKCKCGVAFCWICGMQIEDTVFPAHFQWWNPGGCANMQLNEAIEPSRCFQVMGRLLAIFQMIVFGPITFASVLVSSIVCLPCIFIKLRKDKPASIRQFFRDGASNCLSGWGMFWMLAVTLLPLALAVGGAVGGILMAGCIILYPCYFIYRISRRKFPVPSFVTTFLHRLCCRPIIIAYEDYQRSRAARNFEKNQRKHLESATGNSTKSSAENETDLFQILSNSFEDEKCKDEESKANIENHDVNSIIVDIELLQRDEGHSQISAPDTVVTSSEEDNKLGLTDIGEIGKQSENDPSSIFSDDNV